MQPAMLRGGDYTLSPKKTEKVFGKTAEVLDPESDVPLTPDERSRIKNARRYSTVGLIQSYGHNTKIGDLPKEIQNDILKTLNPLARKSDEKERTRKVLDTTLAELPSNYDGDNWLVPTKEDERKERIQNLTALANLQPEDGIKVPDLPESVKADLLSEADLLKEVGRIIETKKQVKETSKYGTDPDEDPVAYSNRVRFGDYFNAIDEMADDDVFNRRIEQKKRAYQESRDPLGRGDATRTRNEVTGELETGFAGQVDDPLVDTHRQEHVLKSQRPWSTQSKDTPDISYEGLRLIAKNSGRNDLNDEAEAIYNAYLADDEAQGRSLASKHLIENLDLNQKTIKPFRMEKRETDANRSIPMWDVQAPMPGANVPIPSKYAAKIESQPHTHEQYPSTHDYGIFTPEEMVRDLEVGELPSKELLQKIGEGTYRGTANQSKQFNKVQKNQKLGDLLKSIKKGTVTPEQHKEYASVAADEAVSLIGWQSEMTGSLAEIDINEQIDRFDEQAKMTGGSMSNLPENYRELQAQGKLSASDVFDYEEDSGGTPTGMSRGQTGLTDRHRQTVIDMGVTSTENLMDSIKPQMNKLVQQWMKKNPEEFKKISKDPQEVALRVLREYYQSLIDSGSLLDRKVSPFTAPFGEFNPVTNEFDVGGLQTESDPRVASMMGLAPQAIAAIDAGTYLDVLGRSHKTTMALAADTDMKSLQRQIKELQATAADTNLTEEDRRYIEKELGAKRDAFALAEDEARRWGLLTKKDNKQLTFEESLQKARQQNSETRVYLGKGQSADEFVKSVPKAKVSGDSVVTLSSVAMKRAMQKGLVKPGYKAVTKVYSPDEESSNPVDFRHDDGSYNTLVANIHLNNTGEELDESLNAGYNQETDRVSPRIIEEISKIARDEFGLTGLHYNPADNVIEIVRPHGEDRTDWAERVAEFNATYGRDIARGGGRSDPEVRLETVRLLQDQTAARPRQGLSRTGLRRSGRGTDKPSEPPVSPSVKLARDYAAANPDYNGDHTKWNSSKDFPLKTWSDFDQNDPASDIAFSNYISALDQVKEFENDEHFTYLNTPIERAIESYAQNAADTAKEQGLGKKVAGEAFEYVFALAGINKLLRSRD